MMNIIKCPNIDIAKGAQSLLNFTFCALTNIEVIIRVIVLPLYITIFLFHFIKFVFFFFFVFDHKTQLVGS